MKFFTRAYILCIFSPATALTASGTERDAYLFLAGLLLGHIKKTVDNDRTSEMVANVLALATSVFLWHTYIENWLLPLLP